MERTENAEEALFELDLPGNVARAREYLRVREPAIEGQGGDSHTFVTVCQLKDFAVSDLVALELLLEPDGWNERCVPSWDAEELAEKVEHAYRYGKKAPGEKGGVMDLWSAPSADAEDEVKKAMSAGASVLEEVVTGFNPRIYTKEGDYESRPTRETIIREWLPAHGMTGILAVRGTGKTISMLDVGLHIACDMDWHGVPTKKGWTVVYLCGEDDVGTLEMREAWCRAYERRPEDSRFIFAEGMPRLTDVDDCVRWLELIIKHTGSSRVVVIFDTFQRGISGTDKNEGDQMQTAIEHVEKICKKLGGPSICAFHPPKHNSETIAGAGEIENSSTALWRLSAEANGLKLQVTRIKGERAGSAHLLAMKEIKVAEDDGFGKPRNSVYFTRIGGAGGASDDSAMIAAREFGLAVEKLDAMREDVEYGGEAGKGRFTLNSLAARMKKLTDADQNAPGKCGEWAKSIVNSLKRVGLDVMVLGDEEKLKSYTNSYLASGIDLLNGNRVVFIRGEGKRPRTTIEIKPSGMKAATPDNQVGDEAEGITV